MSIHQHGQGRKLNLTASDLRQIADILESIQSIHAVEVRTVNWNGRALTLSRSHGHQLDPAVIQLDDIKNQNDPVTRNTDIGAQR